MTYEIRLRFEDGETLAQALDYIGESDAPVIITGGVGRRGRAGVRAVGPVRPGHGGRGGGVTSW